MKPTMSQVLGLNNGTILGTIYSALSAGDNVVDRYAVMSYWHAIHSLTNHQHRYSIQIKPMSTCQLMNTSVGKFEDPFRAPFLTDTFFYFMVTKI